MEVVKFFESNKLSIVKVGDQIWWWGKEVAEALGYSDTDQAIRKNVDKEDKLTRLLDGSGQNRSYTYINECGVYSLIFSSKKENAKRFKRWVFHDVLPSIRKTGTYTVGNQLSIMSEYDLHCEFVKEIRKRFPHLMLIVQAGELQDSKEKRISMWKKGFVGGQPDIMITNPHIEYNGMCIEIKTPNGKGVVSEKQKIILDRYHRMNWLVIISDDLVSLVLAIDEYVKGVREICPRCNRMFKSLDSLDRHMGGFHR